MLNQTLSRIRRNHALEHATIHVLSEKFPNKFSAQGNSTHEGFYLNIFGEIGEEDVEAAVREAHARMKAGEHQLAVHPNCGTVLLTTATMATVASQLAFGLEMRRQRARSVTPAVLANGLPNAILAATLALIASRPLGLHLQARYTTDGNLGDLEVAQVRRIRPSAVTRLFQLLLGQRSNRRVAAYQIETQG
jgi:hypothetical protein